MLWVLWCFFPTNETDIYEILPEGELYTHNTTYTLNNKTIKLTCNGRQYSQLP